MTLIDGAELALGEWDPELLERYRGARVLPQAEYTIAPFCVANHAFPGRPQHPWPIDGLAVTDLPAIERRLESLGRRLCSPLELTYAAAGPENLRFPWSKEHRGAVDCETDDERPTSLGSRPKCRSPFGLWDFGVRSSWVRMDELLRAQLDLSSEETEPRSSQLPRRSNDSRGGASSPYWLFRHWCCLDNRLHPR